MPDKMLPLFFLPLLVIAGFNFEDENKDGEAEMNLFKRHGFK
jgi:hypothetical protein